MCFLSGTNVPHFYYYDEKKLNSFTKKLISYRYD